MGKVQRHFCFLKVKNSRSERNLDMQGKLFLFSFLSILYLIQTSSILTWPISCVPPVKDLPLQHHQSPFASAVNVWWEEKAQFICLSTLVI